MSGRAGRRGLDDTGVVIIACSNESDFPEASTLQTMILGQPTKLESQFRLTYNMILNLLRVEAIKVEDMMKRSFSEDGAQREAPKNENLIREEEEKLSQIPKMSCQICSADIEQLYATMNEWLGLTREAMMTCLVNNPIYTRVMTPGRVLIINDGVFGIYTFPFSLLAIQKCNCHCD
jgi:antiviral helicase SKI2